MWKTFLQSVVGLVSRETVRFWINCFARHFADCIRKGRPRPNDKRHLDKRVIMIGGKKLWLWWAIEAVGDVLDILVQARRNTEAAKRFLTRLVRQFCHPPRRRDGQAAHLCLTDTKPCAKCRS